MDRLTEIRLWHADVKMRFDDKPSRAHQDREVLLSEIDKLQAEVGRLRKKMREIAEDCESEYPQSYKKIALGIRNILEAKP